MDKKLIILLIINFLLCHCLPAVEDTPETESANRSQ